MSNHIVPTNVRVRTSIDNILLLGSEEHARIATQDLDKRAAQLNISWKPSDSFSCEKRFTFIGIDFGTPCRTVNPSDKMRKKLFSFLHAASHTAGGVESLLGRILHATAIAGETPGKYWRALKYTRRLCNKLSRGLLSTQTSVTLPPAVKRLFHVWIQALLRPRTMHFQKTTADFTMFVDASLQGWGGSNH